MSTYQMSKRMVQQYAEALYKWAQAINFNVNGNVPAARTAAEDAANRLDYLARTFPIPLEPEAPHPDVLIAQHALRAWMVADVTDRFTADELHQLYSARQYVGTLYQHGSAEFQERYGITTQRPFAYMQWDETGTRWPLVEASDTRVALALYYIQTRDYHSAAQLLGEYREDHSPAMSAAHLLLLEQAGLWPDLADLARRVVAKYNHARTRTVAPDDPEAQNHDVRLKTWLLAMYLLAHAQACLGELGPASTLLTEVSTANGVPTLSALAQYRQAQVAKAQGKDDIAAAALTDSLRISPSARGQAALNGTLPPLRVTTVANVDARTDRWDPDTEPDPETERRAHRRSQKAQMLADADAMLREIVGMERLKGELEELAWTVEEDQEKKARGLATRAVNYNAVLYGPPGTGKTTIMRYLGLVYCAHGLVDHPEPEILFKSDLVSGWVGKTSARTEEALKSRIGRVILIDEAYSLTASEDGQRDQAGVDAVDALVGIAETLFPQRTILNLAGYENKMKDFLRVNPGLGSRIPRMFRFDSFTNPDLYEVFLLRAAESSRTVAPGVKDLFLGDEFGVLQREIEPGKLFVDEMGNARFMRELEGIAGSVAAARRGRARAQRGESAATLTNEQLGDLTADDVRTAFDRLVEPKRYLLMGR